MKIGIYLETMFVMAPNDKVYGIDTYILLLNKLVSIYPSLDIYLCGRLLPYSPSYAAYELDSKIKYVPIGTYKSIVSLMLRFPNYKRQNIDRLSAFVTSCNHLIVATGGPLAEVLIKSALEKGIDCSIIVRANGRKTIMYRYRGIKRLFAFIATNVLEKRIDRICKSGRVSVIALGNELYEHYLKLTCRCINFSASKFTQAEIVDCKNLTSINWTGKVELLFVGRLEINKGLKELIEATSLIQDFDWHLTIVGDGDYKLHIKEMVHQLNVSDRISLLGHIPYGPELNNIYRQADILVLPSYCEGLPQVVLEAMANGCLVIASSVGGVPEIVKNPLTGLLCSPRSTQSILAAFKAARLLNVIAVKQNALKTAKQYSQENQLHKLLSFININTV